MSHVSPSCPSEVELLAFHRGTLPERDLDRVAEHLEICPTCESVAQKFDAAANSADQLLVALRHQGTVTPQPVPSGYEGSTGETDPADPANWPTLPGYEVVGVLGRGGMGVVYKARQIRIGRFVALKRLRCADGRELARSRTEAEALGRLQHPGIVQIHEFVEHQGQAYLALELVPGGPLGTRLAGKPQHPQMTASLVETVARAVQFAHTSGIIHRDIKPANILLDSRNTLPEEFGVAKVADFGIAKTLSTDAGETRDGDVIGTPNYMAPEQAAGKMGTIGPATDVYGLGAVLYEMLTGRVPLQGPTTLDTLILVQTEEPVPPRRLQPGIPRDLEVICLKCLEKEPARRYPTAEHLADDLHRFLDHKPILARPTPAWERLWKAAKRHPTESALTVALILVATIGFALVAWQWRRAEDRAVAEAVAKNAALEKERQATRLSAGIALDRGISLCETGELDRGLLWLARSLELASALGDDALERAARCNLAGWGAFHSEKKGEFAHKDWVWAVAISPDDRTVLTGSKDGTARLWDATTGAPKGAGLRHDGPVWAVACSPDGTKILTAGGNQQGTGSARLWDATTGEPVGGVLSHPSTIMTASFSPDGATILTVSPDQARMWRTADWKPLGDPLQHPRPAKHDPSIFTPLTGAFSPDGKLVATGGEDGTARLWDVATGQPRGEPLRTSGPVLALTFSPDSAILLTGSFDGGAQLWKVRTCKPCGPLWRHQGQVRAVAFSADGQLAATGADIEIVEPETGIRSEVGGEARLWHTGRGYRLGSPLVHPGQVRSLAFSPDGRLLMTGCRDGAARFFLVATSSLVGQKLPHEGTVQSVVFSHDGRFAVAASAGGSGHAAARMWTTPANSGPRQPLMPGGNVLGLIFRPDCQAILTWAGDKSLRELDLQGRLLHPTQIRPRSVTTGQYSPDGSRFVTAEEEWIQFWDRASGKPTNRFPAPDPWVSLAFSPDGQTLLAGFGNRTVQIRDGVSGQPLREPLSIGVSVRSVAFRSDGKMILIGTEDGPQLWEWPECRLAHNWEGSGWEAAFLPGGTKIIGGVHGFLHEWSLTESQPRPTRFHPEGGVDRCAISPDGLCALVSGDPGQPARVWDIATGKPLGPAPSPVGARPVAFSPDGRQMAVGSRDGRISVWDTPTPIVGEPARIRLWVEALSGLELDAEGVVVPLAPLTREERTRLASSSPLLHR